MMKCKACGKEIDEHVAGFEMDMCVMVAVFGRKRRDFGYYRNKYSENIADAYQMEERIAELGMEKEYGKHLCISVDQLWYLQEFKDVWSLIHATPEERCKAALMMVSYIE